MPTFPKADAPAQMWVKLNCFCVSRISGVNSSGRKSWRDLLSLIFFSPHCVNIKLYMVANPCSIRKITLMDVYVYKETSIWGETIFLWSRKYFEQGILIKLGYTQISHKKHLDSLWLLTWQSTFVGIMLGHQNFLNTLYFADFLHNLDNTRR